MCSNRLQLNADKTEVMWCTSTRKLTQRPSSPLPVAGALVQPVDAIRDLGVYIDCDLGASTHVRRTVSRYFAALRQLRHLRRYVTDDCFLSLVVSLVHTTLVYGNFVLVRLPAYQQRHVESVLNAAARLSTASLRPHHGCPCNTALAASARTCRFQGGSHGFSRAARSCSTLLESADPRR